MTTGLSWSCRLACITPSSEVTSGICTLGSAQLGHHKTLRGQGIICSNELLQQLDRKRNIIITEKLSVLMKLQYMCKLEKVYLTSCMWEGTGPTVLTLPVYPEQVQCGRWGCPALSIQTFNKNGFFGQKKKKFQQKSFVRTLLEVQRRQPKAEHTEKVGNLLPSLLTAGRSSHACRMRRGASGGDRARLSLPRGFYGSHHSSSPSSTSYFFGAAEVVWKEVQKES